MPDGSVCLFNRKYSPIYLVTAGDVWPTGHHWVNWAGQRWQYSDSDLREGERSVRERLERIMVGLVASRRGLREREALVELAFVWAREREALAREMTGPSEVRRKHPGRPWVHGADAEAEWRWRLAVGGDDHGPFPWLGS